VIANEYRRSCLVEVIVRVFDCEGYAGGEPHYVFEGSRCRPLRVSSVRDQAKEYGGYHSIGGTCDQTDIRCEKTGDKASRGDPQRECVEEQGEGEVSSSSDLDEVEDGRHVGMAATSRKGEIN